MRPSDIRAKLRRQPFQPFRMYISDGSHYDVRHPEMLLVARTEVAVGLGHDADDLPEQLAYCDPLHITRIEPLAKGARRRRGG